MIQIDADQVPIFYICFGLVMLGGVTLFVFNLVAMRRGRPNFRLNTLVGAVVLLLVGGLTAWIGWQQVATAYASNNWPVTTGVVVSSGVTTGVTSSNTTAGRSTSSTTVYGAAVVYKYRVNNRTFSSDQVAIGQGSSSRFSYARQISERYPRGARVMVYYSPDDPAQAVLEPGLSLKAFFTLGVGLAFLLVGLVAAWLYRAGFRGRITK